MTRQLDIMPCDKILFTNNSE